MNIRQLRQREHALKAEGRGLLATAKKDDRALTEQEEARCAEIETELEGLSAQIQEAEAAAERERLFDIASESERAPQSEAERRASAGFANLAEFATAVRMATVDHVVDPRLAALGVQAAPTNYHQEAGGSSGEGYAIPAAFRQEIWEMVFSDEDLLGLIDSEPTAGNSVEFVADETTPWGSAGVQANWRAEGSQMSASKHAQKARQLRLHELYAFVLATDELLEDAPRLSSRLTRKAAEAIRFKASDAIVNGTGAGQPLGWMNSGALVTVAKESGQAAATVNANNVAKMFSRLLRQPGGTPFWMANNDVLPQLMTMTLGDQPIWTPPSSGFANAPGGFLLGAPVRLMPYAQTLGTVGDIQFVDPKGYYGIVKGGGIQFASSMHLYFDYGMQAFRWTFRMNGQPFLSAAVSPAKGSNTLSHFVSLATRS